MILLQSESFCACHNAWLCYTRLPAVFCSNPRMVTISVDHARAVRCIPWGASNCTWKKLRSTCHPPCRRWVKHGPVSATTFPTVCTVDVHGRGLRRRAAPRRARTSRKVEQKDIFSQHNRNENSERTNMVVCLIHIPTFAFAGGESQRRKDVQREHGHDCGPQPACSART